MISQLIINPLVTFASIGGKVKGADTILENDPHGVTVALISIGVVLTALIVLALLIFGFSKAVVAVRKQTAIETIEQSSEKAIAQAPTKPGEVSGEVLAAIAVALKLNKEALHDHESEVITLNTVARVYSPWSSKIHGLTNNPRY
ncbi:MAG: OadG family protein [Rikenellaceae bacterium]